MGDYDLVPGVLKDNGIELLFTRVAIKPGRPITFGVSDQVICFALPGNPVSSFMQFEMMAKPFLFTMMGYTFKPMTVRARLNHDLKVKPAKRLSVLPVRFTAPDQIERVSYHGSAHINALCGTDGVILCPADSGPLNKGDEVDVRLL
jgi:molybdopterin molybdotransferase